MITQVLHTFCQGTDIVKHGKSKQGKQRYKCRETAGDRRTFILHYADHGQSRLVKQQIVDMALNGSGVRDTARVLHVSPSTVIRKLKKKNHNYGKPNMQTIESKQINLRTRIKRLAKETNLVF